MKTPAPPPFFHPFPTRTTDLYAAGVERETRMYFETRMDVPRLPPLPNAVPRTQLDTREARRGFVEGLLTHPTSSAFRNLRDDLRPKALAREIDAEPRRRHDFPRVADAETGESRPFALESPIACRLSDTMHRHHAMGQSALPRHSDDRPWMAQSDLLDPAFCGIERETRTIRSYPNLWTNSREMVILNAMAREGVRMEMPCALGTLSLMDPTISRPQPAEFIAYPQRVPESPHLEAVSVPEGLRLWVPERSSARAACPPINSAFCPFPRLDPSRTGTGNDGHAYEDLQSLHSVRSAILNPSSCAAPSVLQEMLENAPDAEVSAPRSCFCADADRSFVQLMSGYANQGVDIQTLPPVAWPSGNTAVPKGLSMPRMNDASRPVAHLDLYLPWNIRKEDSCRPQTVPHFVPEMEAKTPIPGSRSPRGWTGLLYNAGPPAESPKLRPLSCQLAEATPIYSRHTSPVTESKNAVAMQDPVASGVQYLLKLRGKCRQGGMANAAVCGLAMKSAGRSTAQPPMFASECRPRRRPRHLTVEMTPAIGELLDKMREGHVTLMATLPHQVRRDLSADLFDLRPFRESAFSLRTDTPPGAACTEIRALRETSWCLLNLGISTAYHHLKKVRFLTCSSVFL